VAGGAGPSPGAADHILYGNKYLTELRHGGTLSGEPMDDARTQQAARDDLQYIRRTLAAAGHLSIIPGRGMAVIGLLAIAAVAANLRTTGTPWAGGVAPEPALVVWAALLAISLVIGIGTMAQKARRQGQPFWSPVLRKALWGYAAGMLLGGVLTGAVIRTEVLALLPAVWLGCYGAALVAGGISSVSPVRWMGVCFLLLAAAAALLPAKDFGLPLLAVGFGGLHLAFGAYIAWRHDG